MTHTKNNLFILATVLLGSLIAFAAGEILLRLSGDREFWFIDRPNRTVGLCMYDENMGWRNRPFFRQAYRIQDRRVMEEISSQGLRDREFSLQKPAGVTRIAVLGCSFTFAIGLRAEESYPKQLELLYGSAGKPVEIMNFGVNGYGIDQMVLAYEHMVRDYRPDLVLLQFFDFNAGRALYKELWRTPKPQFRLEGGQLVLKNHPVPKRRFGSLQTMLLKKSRLYKLMFNSLLTVEEVRRNARHKNINTDEAAHRLSQALLKRLQEDVTADRTRLIVFTKKPEYAWLKPAADEAGVEIFSLTDYEDLNAWEQKGNLFNPDNHWSILGNQFVASAIYHYLERNNREE